MELVTDYDTIREIPLKSKITFQEFTLDRHQKAKKSVEIRGELQRIIMDNEGLNKDEIEQYYPEATQTEDFVALSVYPFYRLILIVGVSQYNLPVYKTIHINKYFLHIGLQKLQYDEGQQVTPVAPQAMLGFESYQIGQKFKK